MIAFWFDFLRTPMAAPETKGMRALRMAILWVALALALSITTLKHLRAMLGAGAGGAVAAMLVVLVVLVPIYVVLKIRRDADYLAALSDLRDDAGAVR